MDQQFHPAPTVLAARPALFARRGSTDQRYLFPYQFFPNFPRNKLTYRIPASQKDLANAAIHFSPVRKSQKVKNNRNNSAEISNFPYHVSTAKTNNDPAGANSGKHRGQQLR